MNKVSLSNKTIGPWEIVKGNVATDLKKLQTSINNQPDIPDHLDARVTSILSSPAPRIDVEDVDVFTITQLSEDIISMSMNLVGAAVDGQSLTIRILDDGTPRSITWGSSFASREGTLPTTTTASTYLYAQLVWNAVASTWDCLAAGDGTPITIDASQVVSGTMATARLGSGSATAATLLSGDQTYKQVADAQVASAAAIGWSKISKSGSSLADLATRSASDLSSGTLADGRLSANVPLLDEANTFSHTGNNFTDVTSPKFYFNSGIAINSVDFGSVVNTTINSLSIDGITDVDALIFIITQGTGGFHVTSQVILRGSDHSAITVSDPGSIMSNTSGTGGKVNVYWSGSRYEIENKSTITLRIGVIYLMLRN